MSEKLTTRALQELRQLREAISCYENVLEPIHRRNDDSGFF